VKNRWLLVSLVLASVTAGAKERPIPVSESVAAQLNGRSVVVTRHEKPTFIAMTPGKAMFALVGAAAMAGAGNKLVEENGVADPADVLVAALVPAVVERYGLKWDPSVMPVVDTKKPKEIAATQSGVDYVLDVRSAGWNYSYYPRNLNTFWVGYSVELQLIDVKSSAVVSKVACNSSTNKHAVAPTRDELVENRAQLLKDVTTHLGWLCVQLLAKEQFALPPEATPAIPESYVDPLTAYAAAHPERLAEQETEGTQKSGRLR
jgi:hypothetical protein